MRAVLALVMGSLLVATAHGQDPTKTEGKILGAWEVVGGDVPPGSTIEFTKDGKLLISVKVGGETYPLETTYKVSRDGITIPAKVPGDKSRTTTAKIKKLTDKELVIEDDEGKTEMFKRAK